MGAPFDQTNDTYPSEAFVGYGAALLVGDGASPEVFTEIAEIVKITPGPISTAVYDRTHLRSPEGHREKMPGIRDSGPFGLEGNWRPDHPSQSNDDGSGSPSGAGGVVFLARTRAIRNFKILLPSGIEWPFRGFFSSYQPGEITTEGISKFTAEVQPSQDTTAALP